MKILKERLQKVCIIGATPAGIAATNKLGEMGVAVTLIDEAPDLNEKLASETWRRRNEGPSDDGQATTDYGRLTTGD